MLRSGAPRGMLRSLNASPAMKVTSAPFRQQFASQIMTAARRPQALAAAKPLALMRMASGSMGIPDLKAEAKKAKEKLTPSDDVSVSSSTHPVFGEVGTEEKEDNTDMMAGVKSDLKTIKETFSMEDVPKEAFWIGMAGVIPYVATSLSTVYCAWEINHAAATGAGFLMSEHTAELALHVLEPLQIGYGATIISFLGAIHWGLEWAKFGGVQGYPRYMIGVASTAAAWPTILLPAEYALISQFLIFNFLYYADSRATKRGWAPSWYGVYRFVLTFIVGSAIVVSLVGRGQIADRIGKLPGPADRIRALRESQLESLEEEESARRKYLVSKDEDEDEEEEEEGGEDDEE